MDDSHEPSARARFLRIARDRRYPARLALFAVLLSLPALTIGWMVDDWILQLVLGGRSPGTMLASSRFDLFRFFDGDAERGRALIARGVLPWFTDPAVKLMFMRPLTSATHALDFLIAPRSAVVAHCQSLAWLAALVIVATTLFRRLDRALLSSSLAALFFAIDPAHGIPVGWVANRNALVAGTFAVGSLLAHHRARAEDSRVGAWLAPLLLALALLSGELALGIVPYFVAYALWLDDAPKRRRVLALAPIVVVLAAWAIVYRALGYGASGSALYVDPLRTPGRFAIALVGRWPALAASALGGPASDVWLFLGDGRLRFAFASLGALVVAAFAWAAWPLLARDRLARFWAFGALFAVIPGAATFPNDRTLIVASLGAAGLVGRFCAWSFGGDEGESIAAHPVTAARRSIARALVVVHGVVPVVSLPVKIASLQSIRRLVEPASLQIEPGDRRLVIVDAPSGMGCVYAPVALAARGLPIGRDLACLGGGVAPLHVTRVDDRTLELVRSDGFATALVDRIYIADDRVFPVGSRVRTGAATMEVIALRGDGRPVDVRARFDVPLEDPSLYWATWTRVGLVPFALPRIGESVDVETESLVEMARR